MQQARNITTLARPRHRTSPRVHSQWGNNDEHSENISTHVWLFRRILSAFSEFFRIRRRRDADQGNAVGACFVRQEYYFCLGQQLEIAVCSVCTCSSDMVRAVWTARDPGQQSSAWLACGRISGSFLKLINT
jgi:hypothetical protein